MALDLGFPGAVDFIHDESGAQSNSVDDDIDSHSAIPAAAHLRLLTILDEWYPPARHDATSPPVTKQKSSSDVNRREKRWLLNAYPQAYAAAPDLGPHLTRERAYQRSVLITGGAPGGSSGSAAPPAPRALLAVGEMLDVSDVARRGTARLVAAVTGEAGQLLRLVRVTSERWKWSDDRLGHAGCSVSLLTQRDAEETVWHGEGSDDGRGSGNLPITQLKMARFTTPATGRNKLGVNTSWLLVQRASETAVLEPEYHGRRPVGPAEVVTGGHASAYGSAIPRPAGSPRMSSISTGVVATVTAAQTGLNAGAADHVDVDFNPPHGNAPPQIAIVDERGGWSVWDVAGRKTTFVDKRRAVLVACGVGFDGESERGWHRVLWVGKDSEPGDVSHGMLGLSLENDPHLNAERAEHAAGDAGQLVRSRVLLLCNTSVLTTVDVLSGESLARVRVADIFGCGRIIDVLRHPVKMNEIFVLTEAQLLWVDVFPLVNGGDGCQRMSVIQACDISGDYEPDEGLRLGTLHCGQRWPGDDRITVYIHSTKRQKLDIVSLFPARSGLSRPRCLKQQNCLIAGTHSLGVSYHHITRDTHFAEAEKQGKLLQLFVLKSDLSLHSATAAVWNDGEVAPLVLPDVQRNMGKRLAGRERAMEDFKRGFVVPDVYGDLFADVRDHATKPGDRPTLALVSTKSERKHRRWRNFEGLLDTALTYHRYSERIEGPGANLVDLALEYVQEAMEERPPSMDTLYVIEVKFSCQNLANSI